MTDIQKINELCSHTMSAETLNALHACRPGHPLGRDNGWKWRNAYALVRQRTMDFLSVDTSWLERQAQAERGPA